MLDYLVGWQMREAGKLKGKTNKHLNRLGQRLKLSMSLDISLAMDAYATTHKRAVTNPFLRCWS